MKILMWPRFFSLIALAGALLGGCKVQKTGEGANKKVDIETPLGSMHVNTEVDPRDTGLDVYPGATRAAEQEGSRHAANLSIDNSLFGVKVVAIKYRSDDPPDKLLAFYRKRLKSYGDVSECHGSVTFVRGNMVCKGTGTPDETNLVSGTEDRHRIVSVKPDGSGSQFALIYVQARGEKQTD
jgi:hypothetical protein